MLLHHSNRKVNKQINKNFKLQRRFCIIVKYIFHSYFCIDILYQHIKCFNSMHMKNLNMVEYDFMKYYWIRQLVTLIFWNVNPCRLSVIDLYVPPALANSNKAKSSYWMFIEQKIFTAHCQGCHCFFSDCHTLHFAEPSPRL